MKLSIEGKPAFAYVNVVLEPGESITAESDAMASMEATLEMKAKLNGGMLKAPIRKFLGGESLFVNEFTNNTPLPCRLTLVQATPGDVMEKQLNNETYFMQPGAYIASTPGVKIGIKWAGISSWIGGEGLFKIVASGTGSVLFGAYGGLVEKHVEGEYIVDSSHLVAYDPQMKLKTQMAGGIFSSLFGGEGLVTRISGTGKIVIQSRSLSGLSGWLNKYI